MATIDLQYQAEDWEEGDETEGLRTITFPAKMEVCNKCNGEGFVLNEGMRGVAYSQEEFEESFDEEEAAEYFKRGGRYDVVCPHCEGKNVVPVVDESQLKPEQKAEYELCLQYQSQRAQWDREDRMTMRMECGGYDW